MNRGLFFSLDLAFALVLFIALFAFLYQGYIISMHYYKYNSQKEELYSYMQYIENKIALDRDFSCILVSKDNNFIKYISFCIDKNKFNSYDFNIPERIKYRIVLDEIDKNYGLTKAIISESLPVIVSKDGKIYKKDYIYCYEKSNCNLDSSKLIIEVGYE